MVMVMVMADGDGNGDLVPEFPGAWKSSSFTINTDVISAAK